jgi:cytochrome P450
MKRKSGEIKSQVPEGVDLLSFFLQNPDVFDDEAAVDELAGFFLAAVNTTQYTLQTLVASLSQSPEILQKIRNEFNTVSESYGEDRTGLTKTEFCKKILTMENLHDLEYMSWVMNETLRM